VFSSCVYISCHDYDYDVGSDGSSSSSSCGGGGGGGGDGGGDDDDDDVMGMEAQ